MEKTIKGLGIKNENEWMANGYHNSGQNNEPGRAWKNREQEKQADKIGRSINNY